MNHAGTVAAYRGLADDPDRAAALDRDLAELARRPSGCRTPARSADVA